MNGNTLVSALFLFLSAGSLRADRTIPGADCPSSLAGDVTLQDCGVVMVLSEIDLRGHKLALRGLRGLSGAGGAFTDSSADASRPGELLLEAVSDFSSSSVGLSGNLRLVKDGAARLVAERESTSYAGGTVVRAGALKIGAKKVSLANFTPLGAKGSAIDVLPGGVLDTNGKYNFAGTYDIRLGGGTVYNSTAQADPRRPFNPRLTLCADSRFHAVAKNYTFAGAVALNGHELELRLDGADILFFPDSVENGRLKYAGDGALQICRDLDMRTVDLDLSSPRLDLQGHVLSVSNYVARPLAAVAATGGCLRVYGTFHPKEGGFFPPTMMDGSTIDLSEATGAWRPDAEVLYEPGARVRVDVGERGLKVGDRLVAWEKETVRGLDLRLVGANAPSGLALSLDKSGVVVVDAASQVTEALWTGAGGDGDVCNALNWECRTAAGAIVGGSLPDCNMTVTIPYESLADVSCPPETPLAYKRLVLAGAPPTDPVRIPASRDWRGLGDLSFMMPLDLNGHDLRISLGGGLAEGAVLVTNAQAALATLHVSVPRGETHDNRAVAIGGNVAFVKEGAGTFVATRRAQSYAGATVVSNGVLRCAAGADMGTADRVSPFGGTKTVCLAPGGVLDPAGSHSWADYVVNLWGGAVSNSVAELGCENKYLTTSFQRPFDPTLELCADALLFSSGHFNFKGTVRAAGRRLSVALDDGDSLFAWAAKGVGPFTLTFERGKLMTLWNFPPEAPEMTLDMHGGTFDFGCENLNVSNYVARTFDLDPVRRKDDWHSDKSRLNVSGTFTPAVSSRFFGCTLLDGSTIDLSSWSEAWSPKSEAKTNGNGRVCVEFAPGARVTVDVGGRTFKGREQVVRWEADVAAALPSVAFGLDARSRAAGRRLSFEPYADEARRGGLWVDRTGSFLLLVQ